MWPSSRNSLVERSLGRREAEGIGGRARRVRGLQATVTDVLVRVQMLDGTHSTELVHPSRPWIEITTPRGTLATAGVFLTQGVEHILLGVDHLLFVLGLVLLVNNRWMLIKTITAFTVAHSITLALATLGYVHVPAAPLNAAIALSILFLGVEVVRSWRGETSLTIRHPWVVAFAFGLLHGFGFASGLVRWGCRRATSRWRYCRSTLESNSASSDSSPSCSFSRSHSRFLRFAGPAPSSFSRPMRSEGLARFGPSTG